mmetsp:Transcript_15894/g.25831  ORF Transcript_15894/g.25831 Transcript_15894/m.25831 type:complete len:278 (-) Transcript_15894:232-1065(-)
MARRQVCCRIRGRECSACGHQLGYIFGMRGFGFRERRHRRACVVPAHRPSLPDIEVLSGIRIPEEFRCCICLSASSNILSTDCSHRLCRDCFESSRLSACPVCGTQVPDDCPLDADFIQNLGSACLQCGCGKKVPVLEADQHACAHTRDEMRANLKHYRSIGQETQINRSTFACPLCKQGNLTRQGLLEHVESRHSSSVHAAVCPICASMPWGDPAYVSRDFVSHLKLRHRFDFDLVGDYALSEEESLRHAIQLSSDELREEDEWLQRVIQISSYEV